MSERVLNVSALPGVAAGPRATIWWGVVALLTIEGTMFGLLVATYFYLRMNYLEWPPSGTPPPDLLAGSLNMLLLLGSIWPMILAHRAALKERRRPIWFALATSTVIGFVSLALRAGEFLSMHCRWDTHAYGSIVWTMLGMHTGHLIASNIENLLLALLMRAGPVERKHFVDANVNAVYWYFVVLAWLPLYFILYFGPRLL